MYSLSVYAALVVAALSLLSHLLCLYARRLRSPLRVLNGPPSPSILLGNLVQMHNQENTNLIAQWEARYGSTFVYRGFAGGYRLMTTDPVAVAHILGNAYDYPKPDFVRDSLARMAAGSDGLLVVEGETHRRQRKLLAPAFSATHIKSLAPIFWSKANHLRNIWLDHIPPTGESNRELLIGKTCPKPLHTAKIDVLPWLGRATLDVIGLAGFGYAFNALEHAEQLLRRRISARPSAKGISGTGVRRNHSAGDTDHDELAQAFGIIFSTSRKLDMFAILQIWFPFLQRFRQNSAVMVQAHKTMRRIGMQLVEQKRQDILKEQMLGGCTEGSEHIAGDKTGQNRDLLSVLMRSNMTTSLSEGMSMNEVLCQISTFLAAGHETTASALTWCLYALARDPCVQDRLRAAMGSEELGIAAEGEGSAAYSSALVEGLARCEYLEWVVRECLRVYAPVNATMRICKREEDEVPVSGAGYVDRMGRQCWTIRLKKGDIITVPLQAINKSKALWGADAEDFRPERWADPPNTTGAIPGLHAHSMSFLNGNGNPIGGNRACIGYKFSLVEIKTFLYVLLKDMRFSTDPAMVVEKTVNVVTRPSVKSEPHLGNQMPLYVSRIAHAGSGDGTGAAVGTHGPCSRMGGLAVHSS